MLRPLHRGAQSDDGSEEWALTSEAYLGFLKKAFSLYMKDMIDGRYTSVRQFDNFVRLANFGRAEQCGMNGGCSRQFVVEGDGAVYPCDFYCLDEYCLGNINETDFAEMEKLPRQRISSPNHWCAPKNAASANISAYAAGAANANGLTWTSATRTENFRVRPASYETYALTPSAFTLLSVSVGVLRSAFTLRSVSVGVLRSALILRSVPVGAADVRP